MKIFASLYSSIHQTRPSYEDICLSLLVHTSNKTILWRYLPLSTRPYIKQDHPMKIFTSLYSSIHQTRPSYEDICLALLVHTSNKTILWTALPLSTRPYTPNETILWRSLPLSTRPYIKQDHPMKIFASLYSSIHQTRPSYEQLCLSLLVHTSNKTILWRSLPLSTRPYIKQDHPMKIFASLYSSIHQTRPSYEDICLSLLVHTSNKTILWRSLPLSTRPYIKQDHPMKIFASLYSSIHQTRPSYEQLCLSLLAHIHQTRPSYEDLYLSLLVHTSNKTILWRYLPLSTRQYIKQDHPMNSFASLYLPIYTKRDHHMTISFLPLSTRLYIKQDHPMKIFASLYSSIYQTAPSYEHLCLCLLVNSPNRAILWTFLHFSSCPCIKQNILWTYLHLSICLFTKQDIIWTSLPLSTCSFTKKDHHMNIFASLYFYIHQTGYHMNIFDSLYLSIHQTAPSYEHLCLSPLVHSPIRTIIWTSLPLSACIFTKQDIIWTSLPLSACIFTKQHQHMNIFASLYLYIHQTAPSYEHLCLSPLVQSPNRISYEHLCLSLLVHSPNSTIIWTSLPLFTCPFTKQHHHMNILASLYLYVHQTGYHMNIFASLYLSIHQTGPSYEHLCLSLLVHSTNSTILWTCLHLSICTFTKQDIIWTSLPLFTCSFTKQDHHMNIFASLYMYIHQTAPTYEHLFLSLLVYSPNSSIIWRSMPLSTCPFTKQHHPMNIFASLYLYIYQTGYRMNIFASLHLSIHQTGPSYEHLCLSPLVHSPNRISYEHLCLSLLVHWPNSNIIGTSLPLSTCIFTKQDIIWTSLPLSACIFTKQHHHMNIFVSLYLYIHQTAPTYEHICLSLLVHSPNTTILWPSLLPSTFIFTKQDIIWTSLPLSTCIFTKHHHHMNIFVSLYLSIHQTAPSYEHLCLSPLVHSPNRTIIWTSLPLSTCIFTKQDIIWTSLPLSTCPITKQDHHMNIFTSIYLYIHQTGYHMNIFASLYSSIHQTAPSYEHLCPSLLVYSPNSSIIWRSLPLSTCPFTK